jgi:hypothetical protein
VDGHTDQTLKWRWEQLRPRHALGVGGAGRCGGGEERRGIQRVRRVRRGARGALVPPHRAHMLVCQRSKLLPVRLCIDAASVYGYTGTL